jgi:hypothetical protein
LITAVGEQRLQKGKHAESAKLREEDIDVLGTACGSATSGGFARYAHFHDQGRAPLLSAINNLHDRVDVALR